MVSDDDAVASTDSSGMVTRGKSPSLEAIIMRQYGVRYSDAKRLILESRQALNMSRTALWNLELKRECERRLQDHPRLFPTIITPDMLRADSFRRGQCDDRTTFDLPSILNMSIEFENGDKDDAEEVDDGGSALENGAQSALFTMDCGIDNDRPCFECLAVRALDDDANPADTYSLHNDDDVEKVAQDVTFLSAKPLPAPTLQGDSSSTTEKELNNIVDTAAKNKVQTARNSVNEQHPREEIRMDLHDLSNKIRITDELEAPTDTEDETDSQRDEEEDKPHEETEGNSSSQSQLGSCETDHTQTERVSTRSATVEHAVDSSERTAYGNVIEGIHPPSDAAILQQPCLEQESERTFQEDHDDTKTEAEWIADDCSQATDNSKCFTTADELETENIIVDLNDHCGDVDGNNDDEDHHRLFVATVKRTDEVSIDTTAMLSVDTIPCVIYLKNGPPEVPDDESLFQSYNLPMLPPVQRGHEHGRIRGLGRKIGSRLGIFRRKGPERLSDNDSEAHRQTLVAL